MERTTKRNFISVTFLFGIIGVALMIAAFATDHWIRSSPRRPVRSDSESDSRNSNSTTTSPGGSPTKNTGKITFGLFRGHRVVDYGTGPRHKTIYATCNPSVGVCMWTNLSSNAMSTIQLQKLIGMFKNQTVKELTDYGLFSFGLWVSTIVTLALGVVWGLVSIMFAIFNVFGKPIETITGPMGLYLWNGLALLCSLLSCILYIVLFMNNYRLNILPFDDVTAQFSSHGRTSFDYSFYFVVGTVCCYLFNILLLLCSGQNICGMCCPKNDYDLDTELSGTGILY